MAIQIPPMPVAPVTKKNHVVLVAIGLVIGGAMIAAALGIGQTKGPGSDLPVTYCDGLVKANQTFQDFNAGTLTDAEMVSQLASEENEISGSSLLISDPAKAAAIQAVADALGRWKVAVASGTDPHPASLDLGAALAAAPTC